MSSYLSPSVDHNLYSPVLPQSPVAEIFQLMGVKQQMYDSNLAQINNQISSMNELNNAVTNEGVQNKVNNFNKDANSLLKQYTNLDFSIRDNVNVIDKLYDPLINDEDFSLDYAATAHYRSELQKGFRLRDSTKKEERDGFNVTNMNYVTGKVNDLKSAKNTKELKFAANQVKDRYYVPYTDVRKNAMDNLLAMVKEGGASVEYSSASNGYIVTQIGRNPQSMSQWIDATMSDRDRQQLRIEATVDIDNLVASSNKEKVVTDYVQSSIDSTDKIISDTRERRSILQTQLGVMKKRGSMNNADKSTFAELQGAIGDLDAKEKQLQTRKEEIEKISSRLSNDTFNYDDILELAIGDLAQSKKENIQYSLASSFTVEKSLLSEDATYNKKKDLEYKYANMAQEKELSQKRINADLAIAGLKYDNASNSFVANTFLTAETSTDAAGMLDNIISTKNGTLDTQESLANNFKKLYEQKHAGEKVNWSDPGLKFLLKRILDPNSNIAHWDPDYVKLRDNAYSSIQEDLEIYNEALNEKTRLFELYKKENPNTTLTLENGQVVDTNKKKGYGAPVFSLFDTPVFVTPLTGIFMDSGDSSSNEELKKFNTFVNNNDQVTKIFTTQNMAANGAAGKQLLNELMPSLNQYESAYSSNTNSGELMKLNKDVDQKTLDLAYRGIYKLSNLQKTGTDKDLNINPNVKMGMQFKGTNIMFPGIKIEDVFEKDAEEDEYTPEQIAAFNLITSKGLNLPLIHSRYTQVNTALAKVNEGGSVASGSFLVSKNLVPEKSNGDDAYIIYPKDKTKGHYQYEVVMNDINAKIPVTLDNSDPNNPTYMLESTTTPITFDKSHGDYFLENKFLTSFTKPLDDRINAVETDVWKSGFTAFIKKNPNVLIKEGNKFYINYSKIKSFIDTPNFKN